MIRFLVRSLFLGLFLNLYIIVLVLAVLHPVWAMPGTLAVLGTGLGPPYRRFRRRRHAAKQWRCALIRFSRASCCPPDCYYCRAPLRVVMNDDDTRTRGLS